MVLPTISVIMATLNAELTLEKCLESIRGQSYDQKKIEIIVADGGSTDKTLEIAKKYDCKVIPENTGSPEGAKAIALKQAKNEIVLEVDCDNVLPEKIWLKTMVAYFKKEPNITGIYTWRYRYSKSDKTLNRYFSLLGANDPVAWFLGRTDRQSYLSKKYALAGAVKDKGKYFLIEFNNNNMPTLGANGFLIKRKALLKALVDEKHFFHIDVNWDLINQGNNRYVVAKNDIGHISGENVLDFFRKRKRYMENLYLKDLNNRRFLLYDKERDKLKVILYSIYSLTLAGPLSFSMRGYLKIRDIAWFLHPIICWAMFWIYFVSVVNWQVWNYLGILKRKLKLN